MITLSEAKAHLLVEHDADDSMIHTLISAAIGYVQNHTGRTINQATIIEAFDAFSDAMELKNTPVQSVVSVKYLDASNVEQTLAKSVYRLDTRSIKATINLEAGQTWPSISDKAEAVTIEYIAGYSLGTAPTDLKAAALLVLGSLYEQRENHIVGVSASTVPMSAELLMQPHTVPVV